MTSVLDDFPAFLAAAFAPAAAASLYVLAGLPLDGVLPTGGIMLAMLALAVAFFVAALHVLLLALPLHLLLSRRRRPGPVLIVAGAALIGAVPMPIVLGSSDPAFYVFFGLLGLIGGTAFMLVSGRRDDLEGGR
jgi:hypothetical protein